MSSDLLATLAFLGTPVGINLILGWLMVNWAGFVNLDQNLQKLIKLVIAIVMAFGSSLLLQYVPGTVFDQLQPYWKILYATLTGVFGQEFGVLLVQWRQAAKVRFALEVAESFRALGLAVEVSDKLITNYITVKKATTLLGMPAPDPTFLASLDKLKAVPPEGAQG